MDFHSLSRRELQTLCKKNKIPANQTNVAMADALASLELVEGIEEILHPSQSVSTQSTLESYEMSDLTSPYVPATGGRSTRRKNIPKDELGSVNPATRTRQTARKNLGKDSNESQADAIETPALIAQSNRNKGKMASVCRKMDSQLKECAEEEEKKKEVNLMTPAPLGAASRRRRVEETVVKHAYSTRRSVRLAEKTVEKLHKVENDESEFLRKELLTDDGENEEIDSKAGAEDINEISGVVDAIMEENTVYEDKFEFVSAEDTVLPLNLTNEVQQNDVEKTEELNTEMEAQSEYEDADFVENVILESKDNFTVDDFSSNTQDEIEIEKEVYHDQDVETELSPDFNMTLVKFTELQLQKATKEVSPAVADAVQTNKVEPDEIEVPQLEEREKAAESAIPAQLNKDVPDEIEVPQLEESEKDADMVPQDAQCVDGAEDVVHSATVDMNADFPEKTSTAMKMEEENIGSGVTKLVVMQDGAKVAKKVVASEDDLAELSVRKLGKMLKNKLQITNKSSKNADGKEALSRTALQALPENQLVD
ncbi:hypothetical protein ABFS82_06G093200 [Erythranthe guttata]|uniref:Uncharacterized protein n=1 Tax=Erythranthe guttata TaxID=4155 RepID=A0A022PY05_ERYGU|nr:PREDICTED: uncharacterized protein LOC105977839 isoform X1 [Erythranthe guttata]EYU19733.1 hypothetical protein MIMGU_mgv1a004221mg [Erythranthe guttata]|eukprot:XP_012858672.1 PREDICTED: uncharacterized protein LOC105977839 isoform X1 [Erythranthe guttata]